MGKSQQNTVQKIIIAIVVPILVFMLANYIAGEMSYTGYSGWVWFFYVVIIGAFEYYLFASNKE